MCEGVLPATARVKARRAAPPCLEIITARRSGRPRGIRMHRPWAPPPRGQPVQQRRLGIEASAMNFSSTETTGMGQILWSLWALLVRPGAPPLHSSSFHQRGGHAHGRRMFRKSSAGTFWRSGAGRSLRSQDSVDPFSRRRWCVDNCASARGSRLCLHCLGMPGPPSARPLRSHGWARARPRVLTASSRAPSPDVVLHIMRARGGACEKI